MTEEEMVGWHHRLYGHEFEQTPGDSERQGSLACCSPWGHQESDTTERPNNSNSNVREQTPGLSVQSVHAHVFSASGLSLPLPPRTPCSNPRSRHNSAQIHA